MSSTGPQAPAAEWFPASWKSRPAAQQPVYRCEAEVERVVEEIAKLPPLVTSWEVDALKAQLAEAARGERFLLQGGDCAESFEHCDSGTIANKLKILLQMSLVLTHGSQKRVIRVGRFAGQYAKPRSDDSETRERHHAAELSRRPHQSPGVHRGRANPRPAAHAARLRTRRAHAQLHSRAGQPRLRRSASPRILGSRLGEAVRHGRRIPADGAAHRRVAAVHGEHSRRAPGRTALDRFLHQPRRPAPALRAGADAARTAA